MRSIKVLLITAVVTSVLALTISVTSTKAQGTNTSQCTDAAFLNQLKTDLSGIGGSPDYTKGDAMSVAFLKVVKLRYQYEDLTPPAGCEAAQKAVVRVLSLSGDIFTLKLAELADAPNKDAYEGLITNTLAARTKAAVVAMGSTLPDSFMSSLTTSGASQ